ncbi:MAG: response regulator [Deltaproteobacteria bacterium]|jgi:two-component system chemotaxis response regulator CheY|nr:response regulator [Deltaproteobacteria bacterium]
MSYNIMIVDDSRSMRKVIRKVLDLSGFQIGEYVEAGNGQEALDLLENHWIDVVLSDIHMPVMDGFGFIRALRDNQSWSDLPVVFITTESNEDRLQEAMELGARGYIRKPFQPEEIRSLLCQIMGEADGVTRTISDEGCDF